MSPEKRTLEEIPAQFRLEFAVISRNGIVLILSESSGRTVICLPRELQPRFAFQGEDFLSCLLPYQGICRKDFISAPPAGFGSSGNAVEPPDRNMSESSSANLRSKRPSSALSAAGWADALMEKTQSIMQMKRTPIV